MSRRISLVLFLGGLLLITAGCTNKKSVNPLANVGSKQPDKVLFDRAMEAMRHNRFDVARITLQTLINTYPDSEFIARAKLAVGDSWYAEGGTTSLAQAEQEYRDFITFFPNMPEAAEAQLKIGNIHYQQMEKADRDYTNAMRAEEEYRNLVLQFPDSKLVPEAKQRLREVQEVLAEREFDIGRFYFQRLSYSAAVARLQSLVERYPLYSRADDVLYTLGQTYESEMARLRARPTCVSRNTPAGCIPEATKARMLDAFTKSAAEAYDKIIQRYPIMDRADEAKRRLQALQQPVPRPTKAAVAQNKAEDASRRESGTFARMLNGFQKHPDVALASKVGDPTIVDPTPVSATDVNRKTLQSAVRTGTDGGNGVSIEKLEGSGEPAENEPAPRSDAPPAPSAKAGSSPFDQPAAPDANELKPADSQPAAAVAADPNELKPNAEAATGGDPTLPPPAQVNEIQQGGDSAATAGSSSTATATDEEISSSKKKKKKGLKKIVPF
jgi:outer membrane protein assembly factor BamD